MAGAASGLLLARVGRDVLLTYLPIGQSLPAPLDVTSLFTLVLSVVAALLFGSMPAFRSTRVDIAPVLRDGGAGKSSRVPIRKGLVVFQVGVSLVVVIGGVLFLRSLNRLLSIDTGFARAEHPCRVGRRVTGTIARGLSARARRGPAAAGRAGRGHCRFRSARHRHRLEHLHSRLCPQADRAAVVAVGRLHLAAGTSRR